MERNIRIPIDLTSDDKTIHLKLEQEFDNLEVLTLKISSSDMYTRQCSDFGVIAGRVLLNGGFGAQNAKVNIFIPITVDDLDRPEIKELYPFETVYDTYPNGVRYNLFPRIRNKKNLSHRAIGNFPDETDFIHYPQTLEIMDKYYKYTTTTNESGDYIIFGVPVGQQDIIMDFDVLDTKSFDLTANDLVEQQTLNKSVEDLRQFINSSVYTGQTQQESVDPYRVPGFIYHGNNNYDVDVVTNIDDMPNIFHETRQITVSPFWGDDDFCDVGITRCDFKINFNYTPTAIFFGYLHAPTGGFGIDLEYKYTNNKQDPEIIAEDDVTKTSTGDIYPFQEIEVVVYRLDRNLTTGSRVRLGVFKASRYSGVFRVSLPMYMDYYTVNEFGDLIPTKDTTIGVPTKAYYSFEIYDINEKFNGRRSAFGGFINGLLPGARIPSTIDGDPELGGWNGSSLFEYDIKNRKRKFYTIKTKHYKHSSDRVNMPGNSIRYFPKFNQNKASAFWNFPYSSDHLPTDSDPEIIGSILFPRIYINGNEKKDYFGTPNSIMSIPSIDKSLTYEENINLCEYLFGLGVQKEGGENSGDVFEAIFSADDFMIPQTFTFDSTNNMVTIIPAVNIFGKHETWNYGDNSLNAFRASLFAVETAKSKVSNANAFNVQKAYNQAVSPNYTFGLFINCREGQSKIPLMEISIVDISDDLPNLIKDEVYSSYNKGGIVGNITPTTINLTIDTSKIHVENKKQIDLIQTTGNIVTPTVVIDNNAYNGKYYYFGLWKGSNALYDISTNYFIK